MKTTLHAVIRGSAALAVAADAPHFSYSDSSTWRKEVLVQLGQNGSLATDQRVATSKKQVNEKPSFIESVVARQQIVIFQIKRTMKQPVCDG